MVARKNKNKSPVVVPSGRITRSQDVLLDESEKGGQKKDVEPAEETAKIGQKRRMSTRTSPIQKEADAPSPAPTPIRKMAGAPAEYLPAPTPTTKYPGASAKKVVQDQGKKGRRSILMYRMIIYDEKQMSVLPRKMLEREKKIQEVPSNEPSQDPTDEYSTDSDDDSEESVYRAEAEPVSEDDDEVEDEEEEEEVKPKKK
ncbi:nucleolin-like [Chenopodium quinoa]|uniref:nucleolin-like n=1 Tax=Chenopodium quinoa TaxID=63459 RepID=UPI000B784B52|nr:nucleolin-like [Chenopodium quinoa]